MYVIINNGTQTVYNTRQEFLTALATAAVNPTPDPALLLRNERAEQLGKDVVRDLFRTLQAQNLTQANEGDLLNRVFPVFCALGDGFLNGARVIANNLTVAGQLTNARKTYLLNAIDAAIIALG
jgi:hypothetical protein